LKAGLVPGGFPGRVSIACAELVAKKTDRVQAFEKFQFSAY